MKKLLLLTLFGFFTIRTVNAQADSTRGVISRNLFSQFSPFLNSMFPQISDLPDYGGQDRKHVIKFSPIPVIFGKVLVGYEYKINQYLSAGLDIELMYYDATLLPLMYIQDNSILKPNQRFEPYIRYYPKGARPKRGYLQANLIYGKYIAQIAYSNHDDQLSDYTHDSENISFSALGLGLGAGRQVLKLNGLSIDFGGGIQIYPEPDFLENRTKYVAGDQGWVKGIFKSETMEKSWYLGPGCPIYFRFNIGYSF